MNKVTNVDIDHTRQNEEPVQSWSDTSVDDTVLDNMTDEEVLEVFILDLVKRKHGDLDEMALKTVCDDVRERLANEINRSLVMELPDEEYTEFEKAVNEKTVNDHTLIDLCEKAKINIADVTLGTMGKFKELYLSKNDKME